MVFLILVPVIEFTRQDPDFRQIGGSFEIGLQRLDPGIGRGDRGVSIRIDPSIGMQLVADQAFRPQSRHLRRLVDQGIGMLEAAEIAPCRVKLARLAQEIHPEIIGITRRRREMVITPAAGWQAFQFQMGKGLEALATKFGNVAGVVEDTRIRLDGMNKRRHFAAEFFQNLIVIEQSMGGIGRIPSASLQAIKAVAAHAIGWLQDVVEQARRIIGGKHLARLLLQFLHIAAIGQA